MSALQNFRLVIQTIQNLENLRTDMVNNANEHLTMLANGVEIDKIAGFINDCATEYLKRIQWQQSILDTPLRRSNLSAGLAIIGSSLAEVGAVATPIRNRALELAAAPKKTAEDITAACNIILTNVEKSDSVWPE